MPSHAADTQSITAFRRGTARVLSHVKASKRPVLLTVRGKGEAVVQDAEAYARLLDIAAQADASEGIRQGLADVEACRVRDIDDFFAEFEAAHGLSR